MLCACIKDPCIGVFCNNGECFDGECLCEDGYTNANCNSTFAGLFSGDYLLTSDCDTTIRTFDSEISISSNNELALNKGIIFENIFSDFPEYTFYGIAENEDSVHIPNQIDTLFSDTLTIPIITKTDTSYDFLYTFDVIKTNGTALRDRDNQSINLQIVYNINDSLVTCSQNFVKE